MSWTRDRLTLHRPLFLAAVLSLVGATGCPDSDDEPDFDLGAGDVADMGGDADVTPDVVEDTDVGSDTTPDVEVGPDVNPDAGDVSPDVEPDVEPDVPSEDTGADMPITSDLRLPEVTPNPISVERNVRISPAITLPRADGGAAPYVYRTSALPAGIGFDRSALTLRGTPLFEGSTSVRYTVRDSEGEERTREFTITVTPDETGPVAPTGVRFIDTETVPSVVRGEDFQFSWSLSESPDVQGQSLHIVPADGGTDYGAPLAVLDHVTSFWTLEDGHDSLGECLRADTEYVLAFVMTDRETPANQSPVDPSDPTEDEEAHYFTFTSAASDGTNLLEGFLFDADVVSGEGALWLRSAQGPSSAVSATWDGGEDAGLCSASGSVLVSNDSSGGVEVLGQTVAVLNQCVAVDESLTYGLSAEMLVPSEQARRGFAVVNVSWYAGEDCTIGILGNAALPAVEDTEDEWLFGSTTMVPPPATLSAFVEMRLVKQPVEGEEEASAPFEAWFDNIFFGPID
jgi:hypothetical protein